MGEELPQGDAWTHGHCPFCKAPIAVKWETDAAGPAEIVHVEPTCESFANKTGDEFIKAVLDGEHTS